MLTQALYLLIGSIFLLASGLGVVWLIPALRRNLTPIESIPCALLLGSGVTGIWSSIGHVAGLRLTAWSIILLIFSLALFGLGLLRLLRDRDGERAEREPRPYRVILLTLTAFAFLLMLREGGSLGPVHDSLDFVAFVQESLQTGELSPRSAIYQTGPDVPPDPRRGSFHTEMAALCRLSGASAADGWRWLPRLLAPLAVLGLGAMFRPWIGASAGWVGVIFFIAATFFSRDRFIQNIGYASRFGWVCGWAALLALGRGLALGSRGRSLLVLAAASPAILFSAHILSGLQVLLALGCAGFAVWIDRGAERSARRSVLLVLIGATALLIPVAAARLSHGADVRNPIFDHLYGVLLIAPKWPVLQPGYLLERFGAMGSLGALLGLFLLPAVRRSRAAGFLAWSTVIPLFILFFPPIIRLVLAAHAQSMLLRVILTIPFAATLGWITVRSISALRIARERGPRDAAEGSSVRAGLGSAGKRGRVLRAALLLGVVLAAVIAQSVATRSAWTIPERRRGDYTESAALVEALAFLEARSQRVETILSDPISSYAIPAYTRHDAVAPYHQHSSPSDPSAFARMLDVQEVLNGRVGLERTFRILRRYQVDLVLLNQSWPRYLSSYGVFLTPLAYGEQRAKFESRPEIFERVYDRDGIAIYRVHDPGPEATLPGDPPNPSRIPDPGGEPILVSGPDALLSFVPGPGPHVRGNPARFELVWRRTDSPYHLPVVCEIKLVHRSHPAAFETPIIGRLSRWITERREGTRIRFGALFRPLVTFYPDFLWAPGETYADEYWLQVPPNARPGVYDIWLRMGEQPYSMVGTLSEAWSNRLDDDWRHMGEIQIDR